MLNRYWGDKTNTFGISFASVIARESFGPEFMASQFSSVTAREAGGNPECGFIILPSLRELPWLSSARSRGLPLDSFHSHEEFLAVLIKKTFGGKAFFFFFFFLPIF